MNLVLLKLDIVLIANKKIQDKVDFLDAFDEADCYIAQADAVDPKTGKLKDDKVFVRHQGNYVFVDADMVNYVDLSPKQLVSVSSALIPFLEHDDAVRALMGANMQRQAVPIIKPQIPRCCNRYGRALLLKHRDLF